MVALWHLARATSSFKLYIHCYLQGYLTKMKKENSPFCEQDVKDLFMNIEEIYDFNK